MAENGDAAAAAGMDVVAGTADRRVGYDEINKTRDYIAATRSKILIQQTDPGDVPDGTVWISRV